MQKKQTLRIATRKSPLALWQATHIRDQLLLHWPMLNIELVPMSTSGDKFLKDKLLNVGGKGLFVKELEDALLNDRADIAVHSMKDVPAYFPSGLGLDVICERHEPFDALLSINHISLANLPMGAHIGTSSLRRQAQLLAVRPDLKFSALRGNIQTRIQALHDQKFDAIILAVSGLERMQLGHFISEILPKDVMLPACGQGALGIECRMNDEKIRQFIHPLNHESSALCVRTERLVNGLLGGNCHVPLAVYCHFLQKDSIRLDAVVASCDGRTLISDVREGHALEATSMAHACADALLAKGATELMKQAST